MIVYHGSTVIVDNPQIIKIEYGRDFGRGFYTTDIKEQAIRWAKRRVLIALQKKQLETAIINIYEFNIKAYEALSVAHFTQPSLEWLDLVCRCRSDVNYNHRFDMVTGKIANDNVGETVSYVVRGIMRREDALERLRFEQINNQICFNTERALGYLTFIDSEEI